MKNKWYKEGHPKRNELVVGIWYDANPSVCYWDEGWFYSDEESQDIVPLESPDYWIELPEDEGLYRK